MHTYMNLKQTEESYKAFLRCYHIMQKQINLGKYNFFLTANKTKSNVRQFVNYSWTNFGKFLIIPLLKEQLL